jgi:hypothetical protein
VSSVRRGDVAEDTGTGALLGAHMGLGAASLPAMAGHMAMAKREAGADQGLAGRIRASSPVPIEEGRLSAFVPGGTKLPEVLGGTKPHSRIMLGMGGEGSAATVAHEIGHADIHANRFGRMLQNPVTTRMGGLAPLAGLAGGIASGFSDDPDTRRAAIVAPLALSAPQLAYEAGATALGLRRMRRQGASMREIGRGLGTILPAQATYGMQAASGVTGALLGQRLGTSLRPPEKKPRRRKEAGLRENFFDKVEKKDGKWEWTAAVNSDGYPKIKDDGKLRLASHVALELAGREPPRKGQVTMHRDNDLSNLHPSNLRVGTQAQNLKMMRDQGRDRPRGVDQEPDDPKYREKKALLDGLLEGIRRATG